MRLQYKQYVGEQDSLIFLKNKKKPLETAKGNHN